LKGTPVVNDRLYITFLPIKFTVDVIPYNNRNDGGPAAGLLSLVEVPEKAIVPFMVNAFDYVTFIHKLT
jgi:hypothetical protein